MEKDSQAGHREGNEVIRNFKYIKKKWETLLNCLHVHPFNDFTYVFLDHQ